MQAHTTPSLYAVPAPLYTIAAPFAGCGPVVILAGRDVVVCDSAEHAADTARDLNTIFQGYSGSALFDLFVCEG